MLLLTYIAPPYTYHQLAVQHLGDTQAPLAYNLDYFLALPIPARLK